MLAAVMTQEVEQVLVKVARRQSLRSLGRSAFFWTAVFIGVYFVALVGAWLLAILPDWFTPWTIAAVPVLGLIVAWSTHLRASLAGAARATDGHLATDDLFLTSLEVERAPGAYQDLVRDHASAEVHRIRADEVAPLPFAGRTAQLAIALAILVGVAIYLPSFEPFQDDDDKLLLGQQREQLVAEQKSTENRKKKLTTKSLKDSNSAEVSQALQEVTKAFREMRRRQRGGNDKRLKQAQQKIGAKWRESRAKSQNQGSSSPRLQSLGRIGDRKKIESWRKDLSKGKADSLRRELSELRDMLEKMAATSSDEEKEKLRKKLLERAQDLAEFLKNNASSRQLNETLAKALNQLQAMATPRLAEQAQKALRQTLELSEMELKNLAQSLRDMKALEQALKALQAARKANAKGCCKDGDGGPGGKSGEGKGGKRSGQGEGEDGDDLGLDGDGTPDLDSLREYEEYYQKLLAEQGDAEEKGPGMGGPGQGEGGVAPENPDQKNDFKTEKSRSALVAGKLLMTLKTKEVGDRGEVKKEYAESIQKVKQGVGEAILQERVPPGYHEAIKKYFDNLGTTDPGTNDPGAAGKTPPVPAKKNK
jgi:hypothetical protein